MNTSDLPILSASRSKDDEVRPLEMGVCERCAGPCEPDRLYCELCRGFEHEEEPC